MKRHWPLRFFRLLQPAKVEMGKVVHPDGESLNELFAILADWNERLSEIPAEILEGPDPPAP
ncbi:hypothetical protein WG908_12890 [Sphingobium sp. AN641]|uniref:hypothetical protein n=1 Tax=Sphingobium sp. AN641 TaxID=3133443 RepID=UPI0030BD0257